MGRFVQTRFFGERRWCQYLGKHVRRFYIFFCCRMRKNTLLFPPAGLPRMHVGDETIFEHRRQTHLRLHSTEIFVCFVTQHRTATTTRTN